MPAYAIDVTNDVPMLALASGGDFNYFDHRGLGNCQYIDLSRTQGSAFPLLSGFHRFGIEFCRLTTQSRAFFNGEQYFTRIRIPVVNLAWDTQDISLTGPNSISVYKLLFPHRFRSGSAVSSFSTETHTA